MAWRTRRRAREESPRVSAEQPWLPGCVRDSGSGAEVADRGYCAGESTHPSSISARRWLSIAEARSMALADSVGLARNRYC